MALKTNSRGDDVRIGPISLFTLIAVICLAVLAVLAFSTSNATYIMTQRQAQATSELYLDETAAQEFIAGLSDELASVRNAGGTGAEAAQRVQSSLVTLRDAAQDAANGQVEVTASVSDGTVRAEFACDNGRVLTIVVTIRDNATFRIDKWKMTAVQNEAEPEGNLWTGD